MKKSLTFVLAMVMAAALTGCTEGGEAQISPEAAEESSEEIIKVKPQEDIEGAKAGGVTAEGPEDRGVDPSFSVEVPEARFNGDEKMYIPSLEGNQDPRFNAPSTLPDPSETWIFEIPAGEDSGQTQGEKSK